MQFEHPAALWLLLSAAVPLFLTRRLPTATREVANLYLWRRVAQDAPTLVAARRARRWPIALLQMLCLGTLSLAVARPLVSAGRPKAAFVFDVSSSMASRTSGGTRLERAKARAVEIARALPQDADVLVVEAANTPGRISESRPGTDLAAALRRIAPTAGVGNISAAIAMCEAAGVDRANLVVFSNRPPPGSFGGRWEPVAEAVENVAITRLAASARHGSGIDALVEIANEGTQNRRVRVDLSIDGRPAGDLELGVSGGADVSRRVTLPAAGRVLRAALADDDVLSIDNVRYAVVEGIAPVRIARFAGAHPYLDAALASNPRVSIASGTSEVVDLAVCGACPVAAAPATLELMSGPAVARLGRVTFDRPDAAVLRGIDVAGVFASPIATPTDSRTDEVIARAGGFPVVVASARDGRRSLRLAFDIDDPAIGLNVAFPMMIANAVDWLSGADARTVVAGEPLVVRAAVPSRVSVTGPDGRARATRALDGTVVVDDTAAPGIYLVRTERGVAAFAVNAAVQRDLAPADRRPVPEVVRPDAFAAVAPRQIDLARVCLATALILFAVEWGWRTRPATGARIAACAALLAGVTGLTVAGGEARVAAVVAIDRSASMPPRAIREAFNRVARIAATMRNGDRLGVVMFGANAVVGPPSADAVDVDSLTSTAIDREGTDIAGAIGASVAAIAPDGPGRIVLLSDGRQTTGDAVRAAAEAGRSAVAVDAVVPDIGRPSFRLTAITAPSDVHAGEPFEIAIAAVGPPDASERVTLFRDGTSAGEVDVRADANGVATATFGESIASAGIHSFRAAQIRSDDDGATDSSVGAVVNVSDVARVLYVVGSERRRPFAFSSTFAVRTAQPRSVPDTAAALAPFDVLVLDDVPSDQFTDRQALAIASHVREDGAGLLVLGASPTLADGRWPASPIADVLPIDLRPRAGSRSDGFSLVLVLDRSGSMSELASGTSKIELAREAVRRVVKVLPDAGSLGVVAFNSRPTVVVPLGPLADVQSVIGNLDRIEPIGSTSIAPSVEVALNLLEQQSKSRRQILLVSDGRTTAADASRLRVLATHGIPISVVATGPNADQALLGDVARASGGRAYFPTDVQELPRVVAGEAARSSRGAVVHERFTPKPQPHPVWSGIDLGRMPRLGDYVVARSKPAAAALLTSPLGDPLLCAWQVGLGRVIAFTPDFGSAASAAFVQWKEWPALWTQSVRWVSRRAEDPSLAVAIDDSDAQPKLVVAESNDDRAALEHVSASVRLPDGRIADVEFAPTAPGRFEGALAGAPAGAYVASVRALDGSGRERRTIRGLYWNAERERVGGVDADLLARIAAASGGRVLAAAESPFDGARPAKRMDLLVPSAVAALACFLFELVFGRVGFRRSTAWFRRPAAGHVSP